MPRSKVPLKKAIETIESIDFSMIIDKMHHTYGWSKPRLEKLSRLYRNFLILIVKSNKPLVPSKEIDEFWHNHILDTKKYMKDCALIFGEYKHHYPYLGLDGKSDSLSVKKKFEETQNLHYKEFGEYIYDVIPTGWRGIALSIIEFLEKVPLFFQKGSIHK